MLAKYGVYSVAVSHAKIPRIMHILHYPDKDYRPSGKYKHLRLMDTDDDENDDMVGKVELKAPRVKKAKKNGLDTILDGGKSSLRTRRRCTRFGKLIQFKKGSSANEMTNYFQFVGEKSLGISRNHLNTRVL